MFSWKFVHKKTVITWVYTVKKFFCFFIFFQSFKHETIATNYNNNIFFKVLILLNADNIFFFINLDLKLSSEIINGFFIFKIGALGQTRTGTPKRARILSPLCLPISPRGHSVFFVVIVSILIHKSFKEVKKNYFPSLSSSLLSVKV